MTLKNPWTAMRSQILSVFNIVICEFAFTWLKESPSSVFFFNNFFVAINDS